MKPRLLIFTLSCACTLLLPVSLVAGMASWRWPRVVSYRAHDRQRNELRVWTMATGRGAVWLMFSYYDTTRARNIAHGWYVGPGGYGLSDGQQAWSRPRYVVSEFRADRSQWLVLPYWVVALALLCGTVPAAVHLRRRRARRPGFCISCGYDLRATPEKCPECGAVPLGGFAA